MRYEIRPRTGVKIADVIRQINPSDLLIIGGRDSLLVQGADRKIDELRRAVINVAVLVPT
jgi:hypothetical protein